MVAAEDPSPLRKAIGDFVPRIVDITDDVTEAELKEDMIHMAFYAGWPKVLSAINVAQRVFAA